MVKHRWRKSMKSFFGSHIDPDKDEQLKESRTETEDKVKMILNLIKEENLEEKDGISVENSKKKPLVELIEDFHEQYQLLYAQYDHLTGALRKKFHGKEGTETSSSSSSDSEPDYAGKDKGSKNGQLESEYQKMADGIKQELETANVEVADLKGKLTSTSEEKEALNLEYQTALNRIREAEEMIGNLKLEVQRLEAEKTKILTDNAELSQKLEVNGNIEAELNQRFEEMKKERDSLNAEKETSMRRFKEGEKLTEDLEVVIDRLQDEKATLGEELGSLRAEVSNTRQQLSSAEQQVSDLSQNLTVADEEYKSLLSKVSSLNQRLEDINSEKDYLIMEKEASWRTIEEGEKITEHFRTLADQLQGEKATLGLELESLRGEFYNVKQQLESADEKVSDLTHNLKAAQEENSSLNFKFSEISNESKQAQNTIQALVADSTELKEKLVEREREISSIAEIHEAHGNKSSALIKELEALVTDLDLKLESLQNHNRDMAVQVESKVAEANELGGQNLGLQARISELEMMSRERGDELSSLTKKLEDNENESLARIESLTAQVNNLLADMDSLSAQKVELEAQIVSKGDEASTQVEGLKDQVNVLQQELESLHSFKVELEVKLEKKNCEISECLIQIENLKEEMVSKTDEQLRILRERDGLTAQMKDMVLEMETLRKQKNEIEERVGTIIEESDKLREEKVVLCDQIFGLEKRSTEKELEFDTLQERHKREENEVSAQIMALTAQANTLQQELDFLRTQKNQLELLLDKEKQTFSENMTQMEDQKTELMDQITHQQKMLAEQEEAYKKLSEEHEKFQGSYQECKEKLEVAERKTEEVTEKFRQNASSKDQMVADLEELVEDLKSDLEVKGDELNTLVDYVRTIEVKLRLSNQKLRVTEQLLTENEEGFRKAEAKYHQEMRALDGRIATLHGIIAANNEAYQTMVTDISKKVNDTLIGVEVLTQKFEEDCNHYKHRISTMSNEIRVAKNWIMDMNNKNENLVLQLQDSKERESALKEKSEQLGAQASKEEGEKHTLTKVVKQLEKKVEVLEKMIKEKDEGLLMVGEEKREAIRQLCLWIDYHRSRYDSVREILSKMPMRGRMAA